MFDGLGRLAITTVEESNGRGNPGAFAFSLGRYLRQSSQGNVSVLSGKFSESGLVLLRCTSKRTLRTPGSKPVTASFGHS